MSQVKYLITVDGVSTEYSHQMFARGYLLKIVDEYPEGTIVKVETVPPRNEDTEPTIYWRRGGRIFYEPSPIGGLFPNEGSVDREAVESVTQFERDLYATGWRPMEMLEPETRTPFTRWFPPVKPIPPADGDAAADNLDAQSIQDGDPREGD